MDLGENTSFATSTCMTLDKSLQPKFPHFKMCIITVPISRHCEDEVRRGSVAQCLAHGSHSVFETGLGVGEC